MIGIALLGAGFAGRRQMECWQRVTNAKIVGLWNRTPERGRALADQYGVPFYADVDALLALPEVDATDIATTPATHLDYTARAVARGKHVLCQKPMANTWAESEAIVTTCEQAGVRLMVNENFR